MLQESKRTLFPALLFLLCALPASASNYMEPKGQILGGSPDSPVRIEVFSNFECTHCREYYLRTIKKVLKEYSSKDKVCVIYHDFPFESHKYDRKASRYAEAASRIGRDTLIKVYDAFYTDQATWSENGKLESTLEKALTGDEFQQVMKFSEDPEIESLIQAQYQLAIDKGCTSTPTSFIFYSGKEKRVEGVLTYIVLKGFIEKIIK
ncbi:MAG: thioredoxin domain-containing protein [Acidobacteriota bacterium]|jgi:protein-disulfide isomerase